MPQTSPLVDHSLLLGVNHFNKCVTKDGLYYLNKYKIFKRYHLR